MPSYQFTNMILLSTAQTPTNLTYSQSWSGGPATNLVEWTVRGPGTIGIAYQNPLIPATSLYAALTVNGNTIRVNSALSGAAFAVLSANNTSSTFICNSAITAQVATFNNYDSVSPDRARLRNLGII